MLQAINDKAKGWLGIVIVALIALPFALWGIQSYVGGGSEQYVAKINDIEISKREFEYTLSMQRQKLQQQFGGKLPFDDVVLKKRVLDQMVNRAALDSAAQDAGYRISDAQLSENIKTIFTRDGKFDRDFLNQVLQSRGMTVSQMEAQLRNDMLISQVMDSLSNTSFITDDEARRMAELEHQQRKISTLVFSLDHFSSGIEITEDEIKAAYESDASRYMLPEKVRVEYVELTSDALTADIQIDEQAIAAMYDDYVATISKKEQRKARHILLKTDKKDEATVRNLLDDIKNQLAAGASFEDMASKHSQDTGSAKQGGDLGWVEAGQMVKPFEDTLYALNEGEVSDVVESEYGLHLIKLEKIQAEPVESLQQKRAELEKMYQQEVISNKFYELSESMATTAYENADSLAMVSEVMGISPKTTDYFTRNSGAGIAGNDKVREIAFSKLVLEDKANSDVIEISPEHVLVLRLLERKAASLQPLEAVRASIEQNLRLKKSHENTLAAAGEAKEIINAGQSTVAEQAGKGVTLDKHEMLTRKDTGKVDPTILDAAFSMSLPEAGKVVAKDVAMYSGDVALVILEEVRVPDQITQDQIEQVKSQLKQELANREFLIALTSIKDKANLKINSKAFQ
ncbi:MAG: SurA N-terminal domain-containing protein [Gammaproteobacteria bacterium]|nr:SurA N-terminal domain-containing protein [Gammaproteobacteria bacterium]